MTARYQLEPLHRDTPDQVFLTDLRRGAAELTAISVTIKQYNEHGRFNASSLQRRFGSWHRSLEQAGLAKVRNVNVSEDDLFNNLVDMWAHLGRQPRYAEMIGGPSRFSPDTYKRRYGGWRNALEAFVRWANAAELTPADCERPSTVNAVHKTPRSINYRLRFLVMRRDNFKCRITGRSPATDPSVILEVDHVVAWEKGGETNLDNLQTLARDINIGKSNLAMHDGGQPTIERTFGVSNERPSRG
jgi:hypothetical protein